MPKTGKRQLPFQGQKFLGQKKPHQMAGQFILIK